MLSACSRGRAIALTSDKSKSARREGKSEARAGRAIGVIGIIGDPLLTAVVRRCRRHPASRVSTVWFAPLVDRIKRSVPDILDARYNLQSRCPDHWGTHSEVSRHGRCDWELSLWTGALHAQRRARVYRSLPLPELLTLYRFLVRGGRGLPVSIGQPARRIEDLQ